MKIRLDPLDKLFSEFVRRRAFKFNGGCEYCGKKVRRWEDLQCSHFIGRRKRNTRYDTNNCVGICFSCHLYLGEHPHYHDAFFRKRLGSEKFDQLILKGNLITKIDREKIEAELKEKLNLIKEGI